jgi:hypothetical protein
VTAPRRGTVSAWRHPAIQADAPQQFANFVLDRQFLLLQKFDLIARAGFEQGFD